MLCLRRPTVETGFLRGSRTGLEDILTWLSDSKENGLGGRKVENGVHNPNTFRLPRRTDEDEGGETGCVHSRRLFKERTDYGRSVDKELPEFDCLLECKYLVINV